MHIEIDLPETVARLLKTRWGNISHRAAEALAVEAYREGLLTEAQVRQMLRLSSRWKVEELLDRNQAYLDYTLADLDHDLEAIRQVVSS